MHAGHHVVHVSKHVSEPHVEWVRHAKGLQGLEGKKLTVGTRHVKLTDTPLGNNQGFAPVNKTIKFKLMYFCSSSSTWLFVQFTEINLM